MPDLAEIIRELQESLTEAHAHIANMRAQHERMFRKGKVTDVDPKKQLYRQEIGQDDDGKPVKSAWIPYSQIAGARKSHSPPSVGQQMMQIAPDGDFAQAVGMPFTWSNDQKSPSDKGDEDVDERGKSKDTTRADSRQIEVDGSVMKIEKGKMTATTDDFYVSGNLHVGKKIIVQKGTKGLAYKGSVDTAGDANNQVDENILVPGGG